MLDDTWTPKSLAALLVADGWATMLAKRGPLFIPADPLPQTGRPGEPEHPQTPCMLWLHGRCGGGYGAIRGIRVHQITHTLVNGGRDETKHLAHQCERRLCGRPDHVRASTIKENLREGAKRKYPDWLLDLAPTTACRDCGGATRATISVVRGDFGGARWMMVCHPCNSVYMRAQRDPGYIRGSIPSGRVTFRMNQHSVRALRYFSEHGWTAPPF